MKGKPINVYAADHRSVAANKEMADLFTVLKCGVGENFNIEKLKFNKIILLADADPDGKHINLLMTTAFHEYFKPLIENGNVYIAIAPLYRITSTNQDPIYFNGDKDLDAFLFEQINKSFTFKRNGKAIKNGQNIITQMRTFCKGLDDLFRITLHSPEVIEECFIHNMEDDEIAFSEKMNAEVTDTHISFTGFVDFSFGEEFVSIIMATEAFSENFEPSLIRLHEEFANIVSGNLEILKDGKPLEFSNIYSIYKRLEDEVKKKYTITRFKGWGETTPDDLWSTVLNPENQRLIQITLDDDSKEIIHNFMNKSDRSFRKQFIKESFEGISIDEFDV